MSARAPLRTQFASEDELRAYVAGEGELVVAAGKTIRATPALLARFAASIPWGNLDTPTLKHVRELLGAELARRRPIAEEIDGWRIFAWQQRGTLVDFAIARGSAREVFDSCGFGLNPDRAEALAWAVEQVAARERARSNAVIEEA